MKMTLWIVVLGVCTARLLTDNSMLPSAPATPILHGQFSSCVFFLIPRLVYNLFARYMVYCPDHVYRAQQ